MPCRLEKFYQIVPPYRRGHGVDQRMIVECFVLHHGCVQDDSNPAFRIVDDTEGRHSSRLDTQHFVQEIG